jgi:hypothetical protein
VAFLFLGRNPKNPQLAIEAAKSQKDTNGAIPVTNAQRKALSRMAEMNSSSNGSKPEPTLGSALATHSSAFCPHEAGAYYLATVGTVSKVINLLAKEIEPPVYTYAITTVHLEQDPDTGKWVWFDGKEKQSPRKNQDGWRLGSKKLYATREGAEAELQRVMAKNGDRVTKVHDLPDCMTTLRKIRSAHHPDRNNPDSDHDLYQAAIEKIDRMRAMSA